MKNCAEVFLQDNLAQVDKADGTGQLGRIEERVLLLVSQHFYGGLAEDGEVERGVLWGRIGKHELMCQRRLPTPRSARDDVEREFGETAAHNFIKARNSGR